MRWLLRLLGWDSYQGFVARRYLLVRESKIRPAVRYSIIALVLARMVLIPVGMLEKSELLWGFNRILEGVFIVVLVFGVMRHSRLALWAFIVGLVISGIGGTLATISTAHAHALLSPIYDGPGVPEWYGTVALVIAAIGGVITFLATFFGTLRAGFTFFTTVPIGGVWIGTMALVCVLSVMSGFESDLRNKILGSNAHIQVTREDGDMTNWRDVKATIDKVPGVVASTPYAQSEIVIAANNNGQPVIIKGIDPKSVGKVTKLVDYIDDVDKPGALKRLDPLVDDNHDLGVKQRADSGSGVDPSPTELPSSDQPIDFSLPAAGSAAAATGSAAPIAAPTGSATPIAAGSAKHY
ncbi:MAG TPA: ABC transporter permease, partial [Kofleriaceae bacterium]|nr:ABC transporter permease [Kofleriaceae bacterium]